MQAPAEQIKIRSSYNLAAMSFTPTEIAARSTHSRIRLPMNRTSAENGSWPASIDDHHSQNLG
jgi:hypothetical protein